jgi:hypothetical protein
VGHVAFTGQKMYMYRIFVENLIERDSVKDLGVDGRI